MKLKIKKLPVYYLLLICLQIIINSGCQLPDHHLIHPDSEPEQIQSWSVDEKRNQLLIHMEWAIPRTGKILPTIIVHPHGGKTTQELKGVIWDLAEQGYIAVAVDYKRFIDGEYQRNTFVWREKSDVTQALKIVQENPMVDKNRIALLGFSQGGMMSLLIAAHAGEQVRTVIAYYPVTDFQLWFESEKRNFIEGWVFAVIRWHFRRESGADNEDEFKQILANASPMSHVGNIRVPVLLVHGDADTSAPLEESIRLQKKLQQQHKEVELLVVPEAVHIFNFRQEQQAKFAWTYTLKWLQRNLK